MSLREDVHRMIEDLPEESLDRARSLLVSLQPSSRPFEVAIDRQLQGLSEEDLASLPTDIGDNLDLYVCGLAKP